MEPRIRRFLIYIANLVAAFPFVLLTEYFFTGRWEYGPDAGALLVCLTLGVPIYGAYLAIEAVRERRSKARAAAVEATKVSTQ